MFERRALAVFALLGHFVVIEVVDSVDLVVIAVVLVVAYNSCGGRLCFWCVSYLFAFFCAMIGCWLTSFLV